jgi:hypothetical protein
MLAAQSATAGDPMSLDATVAEQTLPDGPMRTRMFTLPLRDESEESARL